MRLTLRTLIAWLDDTLTPAEVKAIGHQVSESPFAKELIERIHRVTRQRRLTVPSESGHDSTDVNTVASYLDNQLGDEAVNDFEKKCLTSDVHLAEVASVHQILSMIGHKAKVPADAKNRMYRLVRGREASPKPRARAAASPPPEAPSHPSVRWTAPTRTTPRVLERFGPLAAVLALIAVLGYMAARSLQTDPARSPVEVANATPPPVEPAQLPPPAPPVAVVAATDPANALPTDTEPSPAAKVAPPTTSVRSDEVGSIATIHGMVLRSPLDAATWEPVEANSPLKPQSRIINLAPFRNLIKASAGEITLVDSTEVVFDPTERDEVARFDLRRGQAVVREVAAKSLPFNVRFGEQLLAVTPSPGQSIGLERVVAVDPASNEPAPPHLQIYIAEGKATLKVGDAEQTVEGPGEVTLQATGGLGDKTSQPLPGWVTDAPQSAFDQETASQFGTFLRPGRPILANLVEAMDDPQPKVKEYAAMGLGTLGDMESVVIGLDRKDHPAFHRSVVEVLRNGLAQGGDAAKAVRAALARQYEEPWPKATEQLIVGFPPATVDEATMNLLVEDLGTAPTRGIRALALDNLRALTGRDSLEYDPDTPTEGKGLRAWQDLARRKELSKGTPAAER